jgi:hypothetical protein
MKIRILVKRKETFAKNYLNLMLSEEIESSGVTLGLKSDIRQSVQIYTGAQRRIKGIAKDAVDKIFAKDLIVS